VITAKSSRVALARLHWAEANSHGRDIFATPDSGRHPIVPRAGISAVQCTSAFASPCRRDWRARNPRHHTSASLSAAGSSFFVVRSSSVPRRGEEPCPAYTEGPNHDRVETNRPHQRQYAPSRIDEE
jgi:hypothetical protein